VEEMFEYFWELIISFEEYSEKAYWDVDHYSIGWGTKAKHPNEVINICEANKRSREAFKTRLETIKSAYPHLSLYQAHLIAAFHYNVQNWKPNLEQKIQSGDSYIITTSLINYVKADGQTLDGLKKRRKVECAYLLAETDQSAFMKLANDTKKRIKNKNPNLNKCLL
jgi:GH24 family phage-related lysozyme (muramidase)